MRCKATHRLLSHMNDDSFRRRSLDDKWPGKSRQGATPVATASIGLIKYISQYPEDDFPVLSALTQRKLAERNTGAAQARVASRNGHARLLGIDVKRRRLN